MGEQIVSDRCRLNENKKYQDKKFPRQSDNEQTRMTWEKKIFTAAADVFPAYAILYKNTQIQAGP